MERICVECKMKKREDYKIQIDKNNLDQVIKFENSFYHYDCFVDVCKRKSKKPNASPKWGLALENLDDIHECTKKRLETEFIKDEIYQLMLKNYDVTVVPSKIFNKLEDIYHGRWKGVSCCVPPEDILDMWTQKMDYLKKTRMNNIASGKEMDGAQQINYDISVLLNKYNAYLKWKERNKIIERDVNKVHKDIPKAAVDLDRLSKIAQNQNKEEEDDIDLLLEELFD